MTITVFQQWAPPNLLGRLSGLLALTSFGIFPVSVALAALVVRDFGPAPFFLLAAASLAVAIVVALTQKSWRDFGMDAAEAIQSPGTGAEARAIVRESSGELSGRRPGRPART
jgi:hypothetical protein